MTRPPYRSTVSASSGTANIECRPPVGHSYLTIGQDLFAIQEYLDSQYNASLHHNLTSPRSDFFPAAAMVYTDIQSLRGLLKPADYGSGIEYADGLLDSVFAGQDVGLQIGLWLNGTDGCRDLVDGKLTDKVYEFMKYLKHCRASQVFLRVGYGALFVVLCVNLLGRFVCSVSPCARLLHSPLTHPFLSPVHSVPEFDNPDFGYLQDPLLYRQAFRMLKETCLYQTSWDCPSRVKFVWHSWGASSLHRDLSDFYPGNDFVDWIGVSIFQQVFNTTKLEFVKYVLEYARKRHKPTMIAESTPFGGITTWQDWFEPVLELIEEYDIDMWSYINCNWQAQPMWHDVGFGDTRLSTNSDVMEKWHNQVLQGRFLGSGALGEYCAKSSKRVPKLSHRHGSKRTSSLHERRFHKIPKHVILLTAFSMFSVILALWAWQQWSRRGARRQRGAAVVVDARLANGYGAIETREQRTRSVGADGHMNELRAVAN